MKRSGFAVAAAAMVLAAAGSVAAKQRYYTYEPDSDTARYRSQEITLTVDAGMWGVKIERLYRTRGNDLRLGRPDGRFSDRQLGKILDGEDAHGLQIYAVDVKDGQGFAHGACKGADRAWIAFSPVRPYRDLKLYVLKYDEETKAPALCETLAYRFRAEWLLPDKASLARMEGEEDQGGANSRQ